MKNNLNIRRLNPGEDLEDAYAVRFPVFLDEQGFSYDMDELDASSRHVVLYDGEVPVATGRIVTESDRECLIGRIAVRIDYRGGTGRALVNELIAYAHDAGFATVHVHAQSRVVGFYEKLGFIVCGEEYMEEDVPHTPMILK